ncbi:hypothetical protein Tco_1472874, partial [Tanacetum coccineum]
STVNGEVELHALVNGKKIIITESIVRRYLQLEDAEGVDCLSNATIFEQLALIRPDPRQHLLKLVPKKLLQVVVSGAKKPWGILLLKLVLDLEKTKTTQAEEILSLKRRVKKLEQKKRSRTYGLKRLYKVSLTVRVESSRDKEILGEDASKQGRINAIDANEDITLVNDQDDANMFDVNTLTGDEVLAEQEVATKDMNLTVDKATLAQALAALKSVTTKVKVQDKGKGIMGEPENPLKKKDQISFDEQEAIKLQDKFDEEERLAREKYEANVALTKEWDDI